MSFAAPFESLGPRLVADDWKSTRRPLPLIVGRLESPLPVPPLAAALTKVTFPLATSYRKTSSALFLSPPPGQERRLQGGTRLEAADSKATALPSLLTTGRRLSPSGWAPL